jgi:hypothetical protein
MNGLLIVEKPDVAGRAKELFRRDNLVAWCIVPFDAKKRGPEERAAMMEKLGLKHFAYDWRGEHVPTFDQEWDSLAKHGVALATARAGNVIGGGDWSLDRLVPDSVTAILSGKDLILRNPDAVRPWQHVLDCLNGYLLLVDSLLTQKTDATWNFGP